MLDVIERFCMCDTLDSFDPYDIWKTSYGLGVKKLFNRNRLLGIAPAIALTLIDAYPNNRSRVSYVRQEYAIVRAFAALSLANLYKFEPKNEYLRFIKLHLDWLVTNRSTACLGYGWGLGFEHAARADVVYNSDTPFVTVTSYPLEAFVAYRQITEDGRYDDAIRGVLLFLDQDVKILKETEKHLVPSYGTSRDRIVTNAVSYVMYMYAMLRSYANEDQLIRIDNRIYRLYQFVKDQQRSDGSWLYSPEEGSFIDCFHSCIVLKNILKTNQLLHLENAESVIAEGYAYLRENLQDEQSGLFHRFALQNKPSLVKYDLYDNAEILNLASLIGDRELVVSLSRAMKDTFFRDGDIFSEVDLFNRPYNRNMLRWAVMPYLFASSHMAKWNLL